MIGHKSERHLAFGWAAARCDDLLNLIPARLTAALTGARRALALPGASAGGALRSARRDAAATRFAQRRLAGGGDGRRARAGARRSARLWRNDRSRRKARRQAGETRTLPTLSARLRFIGGATAVLWLLACRRRLHLLNSHGFHGFAVAAPGAVTTSALSRASIFPRIEYVIGSIVQRNIRSGAAAAWAWAGEA